VAEAVEVSIEDRVLRYRALAAEARLQASKAHGSARDSFLFIAEGWEKLAAQMTQTKAKIGANEGFRPRLLAIDDDPNSATLIVRIAAKSGYEAQSITDPRLLETFLDDWMPHVITLDLCMPGLDGMETLELLRTRGFRGSLIVVSGMSDRIRAVAQSLAEARGLKVIGSLPKPLDTQLLRTLLDVR
jgi:CheY-like chemotaxis protein